jgi:hypothetical protein
MGRVSALPVDPPDDPLDPVRILDELPEDQRGFFLSQYRETVEEARDPAGWKQLRLLLRLWAYRAGALKRPEFREAEQAARAGTGRGMLLEDVIRLRERGELDDYIRQHFGS